MSASHARPVLVTGATGLVGARLCASLRSDDRPVRGLSRSPERAEQRASAGGVEWFGWDGVRVPERALAGAGAVVHLAGESIFGGLPTESHRQRIRSSRIDSTRALVEGLGGLPAGERPEALICASAVGFYGSRGEEPLDESAAPGGSFLAQVCRDWETAAREAEALAVRVVSPRIAVVLAREGGALAPMARAFRLGVGGRLGSGQQWFPWIHIDDLVGLLRLALDDASLRGPVNASSPHPVRNVELTRTLARVVHRPAWLPVPGFVLRAALGELADELLGSRRVVPARATEAGFRFASPELEATLRTELG